MRENLCQSVRKNSSQLILKSELFFSVEKHAGNYTILAGAQRTGISTTDYKLHSLLTNHVTIIIKTMRI